MRLKLASQAKTGRFTAALPGQEHEGLQQSQYRVDWPDPEAAWAARGKTTAREVLSMVEKRILLSRRWDLSAEQEQEPQGKSRGEHLDIDGQVTTPAPNFLQLIDSGLRMYD